jgi:hypothetical protein
MSSWVAWTPTKSRPAAHSAATVPRATAETVTVDRVAVAIATVDRVAAVIVDPATAVVAAVVAS